MPSPFPGMDPYLEGQLWEDFHLRFIAETAAALMPQLRPRYGALVEERVYVERRLDDPPRISKPDVTVFQDRLLYPPEPGGGVATLVRVEAAPVPLSIPEEVREAYLEIRLQKTHEVVTVIEVLSPTNKRKNSDGQREFLAKHFTILKGTAHLVELDLLRGGERIPTEKPLPPGDTYAIVSRAWDRPMAAVYGVPLRLPLPTIPIPLASGDPDVTLDLQAVFNAVYDRAGYDYLLDYTAAVEPPLGGEAVEWAKVMIEGGGCQLD